MMQATNEIEQLVAATHAVANQLGSFLEGVTTADPMEPFLGPDGQIWEPVGSGDGGGSLNLLESSTPYIDETGLTQIRRVCRHFAKENPFAINGHENRISYIIGTGHTYTVVDREEGSASKEQRQKVQSVLDDFKEANKWPSRQQETVLREDRDGEAFLRFFEGEEGVLLVRYVEPSAIATPKKYQRANLGHYSFGIETDPGDHETILAYFVNGESIDAGEIQHRKRGTSEAKRGTPIFWAVRHNLSRALKILRNGSTVTEIQTAIGMVRKFLKTSGATVQAWQAKQSKDATTKPDDGDKTPLYQQFVPGAIVNASGNIDYEFPAMGIDPAKYVASLQAELRTIAARLVMSESMFSAKTDDTSRAAAEVAEGPVCRNFERLQAHEVDHDREVIDRVLDYAKESGRITEEDIAATRVDIQGPDLKSKDGKQLAEQHAIDIQSGKLSIQTASAESGYDYEREQSNIDAHDDRGGVVPGVLPTDFLSDDGQDGDDEETDDSEAEE